MIETFYISV